MRPLGIDSQTIFGMPPVDHVTLAADLGCSHVSVGLEPVPWKLDCFSAWSLRTDTSLRREFSAALQDRGVTIALAEGFAIRPRLDVRDRAADLDLFGRMGAQRVSTVSMDPDISRTLDQLAILTEMSKDRGMEVGFEFAPPHTINTLPDALAAVLSTNNNNLKLIIDAMHFFRSGGSVPELAAIDPKLIGYVQLCDVPLLPRHEEYYEEACFNRMCPGDGQLPLVALLGAIPEDVQIGLEAPIRSPSNNSAELRNTVAKSVAETRRLLATSRANQKSVAAREASAL